MTRKLQIFTFRTKNWGLTGKKHSKMLQFSFNMENKPNIFKSMFVFDYNIPVNVQCNIRDLRIMRVERKKEQVK